MEQTKNPIRAAFDLFTYFVVWCFSNARNFLTFGCLCVACGLLFPAAVIVIGITLLLGICILLTVIVEKYDRMGLVPMYAFCFFFAVFSILGAGIKKSRVVDHSIVSSSTA